MSNVLNETKNSLDILANNAGERAGRLAVEFSGATSGYIKEGQTYVKENPTKSLAIAAAAGLIAGALLTLALKRR